MKRTDLPKFLLAALASLMMLTLGACDVHEFPEAGELPDVRLTIEHELSWSEYNFIYNRAGLLTRDESAQDPTVNARYIIRAFHAGDTKTPVYEFVRNISDVTLAPFTTTLSLPEGDWDLYIWQDLTSDEACFYDASSFDAIAYVDPYTGHNDMRDSFEGRVRVSVSTSYQAGHHVAATVMMERPMAKYEFIATDFDKFYDNVVTRSGQAEAAAERKPWTSLSLSEKKEILEGYSVTAHYPMFMPSVYDIFQQKVIDSDRGRRYKAHITPISDTEAVVAFDYAFMNLRNSGIQVMLVLHTPEGETINMTPTIEVPVRRKQITYVRGKFLTTGTTGGLDIDFEFSGDINIEI